MPSHIFVQLGMWQDVEASNVVAYKAAVDLADRKNLPRGREDFHTLSWLQYAYLQQGKFDDAHSVRIRRRRSPTRIRTSRRLRVDEGTPGRRIGALGEAGAAGRPRQGRRRARLRRQRGLSAPAGLSAAKLGDLATANVAVEKLKAMRTQAESGSNAYRAKPFAIMEKEVEAAVAVAQKDTAAAERLLKEATVIELTLDPPSGPPEPIKPSFELYGELLAGPHAGGRGAVPAVAQADAEPACRRSGASESRAARSSQAPPRSVGGRVGRVGRVAVARSAARAGGMGRSLAVYEEEV